MIYREQSPRRSKFELILAVLVHCRNPRHQTSIMYHERMNHQQVKSLLRNLLLKKLLKFDGKYYVLAERGKDLLHSVNTCLEFLELIPQPPKM